METAKGLHFRESHFAPIRHGGFRGAASDRFQGVNGFKAMTRRRPGISRMVSAVRKSFARAGWAAS